MSTAASSAGFAGGFRAGLASARERRIQDQEIARQRQREDVADQRATERHELGVEADRLGLAAARRAQAPEVIERRDELEDLRLRSARLGVDQDELTLGDARERSQHAALERQQRAMLELAQALRGGVEPGFARQRFNELGAEALAELEYDAPTRRVRLRDDDGDAFEGTLEQLVAAFGGSGEAEPIKLGKDDRLIEPGTYRELVGPTRTTGDDDQRDRKIRALVERGIPRTRAEDIVDRNVDIEIVPQTGSARLVDRVNNTVEEIPLGAADTGERPGAAPGRTLWDLAEHGTGPISGLAEAISVPSGVVGGPVAEQTTQARQMLKLEVQNLIRALAVNPRFPVAEMERLRGEISLEPRVLDNPSLMRQRMIAIDEGLRRRLAQAERDAADPTLPRDSREAQAQNASAIRNFLPTLGVPAVEDIDDVAALPGFEELSPAEQEELRRLSRER